MEAATKAHNSAGTVSSHSHPWIRPSITDKHDTSTSQTAGKDRPEQAKSPADI